MQLLMMMKKRKRKTNPKVKMFSIESSTNYNELKDKVSLKTLEKYSNDPAF